MPMEGIRLLAKLQPFIFAWGALHDNEIALIPEDSLDGHVFSAVDLIFPPSMLFLKSSDCSGTTCWNIEA